LKIAICQVENCDLQPLVQKPPKLRHTNFVIMMSYIDRSFDQNKKSNMADMQDQELITHVEIARVIRDIAEGVNNENVDLMKLRLDYVNRMSVTLGLSEEVVNALSLVYQQLDTMSERMVESRDVDVQYRPFVICSGRGRPKISI
jgi:hypothetical protein